MKFSVQKLVVLIVFLVVVVYCGNGCVGAYGDDGGVKLVVGVVMLHFGSVEGRVDDCGTRWRRYWCCWWGNCGGAFGGACGGRGLWRCLWWCLWREGIVAVSLVVLVAGGDCGGAFGGACGGRGEIVAALLGGSCGGDCDGTFGGACWGLCGRY